MDAVVITSPAHAALSSALDALSKTGRVNIYTSYGDKPDFPVDANTLHRNEYLVVKEEQSMISTLRCVFYRSVLLMSNHW